jgi:zinc/manganese transport system substrate-binding protein
MFRLMRKAHLQSPAGSHRTLGRCAAAACAVGALALAATACSSSSGSADTASSPVIIAIGAENEYANVLSQVGGRYVRVSSILNNPNTDPHTFEASPQVAQEVSAAGLIIQNGLGYDSWMDKIESASPNSGRKVIVVQHVLGLPGSSPNPHLWYDPATMPAVAKAAAADLAALEPAHAAYFRARLKAFNRSLTPWLNAIARFKATYPGATAANTEPVADFLLSAMGITNLTPFRFQADIMNGVEPSPQDIALENGFFSQHKAKVFVYNEQVTDALTTSIRQHAIKAGVPVAAVYETMPAGYTYQSWMLAETKAIGKAVADMTSTPKL